MPDRLDSSQRDNETRTAMAANPEELAEIDRHIAIVRDNLRELVEQAAAYSGAADESRNADRIADQEAKLAELLKQREELTK
jgi:predicted RNA-binding protein